MDKDHEIKLLKNVNVELRSALIPLAHAKKVRWHAMDTSSRPYVVSELAVLRARQVLAWAKEVSP